MKKRVMDDFRILKELEKLAEKTIGILKRSKDAHSCREADKLRKGLRAILHRKEEKLEERLTKELICVLGEVAEYVNDPQRSCKSDDFKNLGNEIFDFFEKNEIQIPGETIKTNME